MFITNFKNCIISIKQKLTLNFVAIQLNFAFIQRFFIKFGGFPTFILPPIEVPLICKSFEILKIKYNVSNETLYMVI